MVTEPMQDIGVDEGIFVRGTPLWIDAQRKKSHVILTSIEDRLPAKHQRLLTSIPMAAMLDRSGFQVTVLPGNFRHWMGFGGRQVQLVELGKSEAEVGILLDDGSRRTLLLPSLVPGIDALPPVDHLVIGARGLGHFGESLTAVLTRLVESPSAQRKIIRVETLEVGLAVLAWLEASGMSVKALGLLGRLSGKTQGPRNAWVVVFAWEKLRGAGDEVFLSTGLGAPRDKTTHRVRYYGGYEELEHVLAMTTAMALTVVGFPRGEDFPETLASGRNLTIHHPVEKSMRLDFEALGRL